MEHSHPSGTQPVPADDQAAVAAALAVRPAGDTRLNAHLHALGTAALSRLGSTDPVLAARLRAHLVATASPFLLDTVPVDPIGQAPPGDDPEATFLWLQARHAEEAGIDGLLERIGIATAAVELGRRTGVEEYVRWGRRWRLDAQLTLGDVVGASAELDALQPLVDRLGDPGWHRLLALVRAVRHEVLGEFSAALRLVDEAERVDPGEETSFFALVLRSDIACRTGVDLDAAADAVAARVAGMPYFARGWSARMSMAQGRRDDVELWWRTLVPHLDRVPTRAPEWIVVQVGHAELCCWLEDAETAATLYAALEPWSGLHVGALAHAPYGGPVDLPLGRLAALLGDGDVALAHLRSAEESAGRIGAWPYLALTRAALAGLAGLDAADRRSYARAASRLAARLGMAPLVEECERLLGRIPEASPGLTPREVEVAGLVAEGHSNAAIAAALFLSVRTVENHVSHVLTKLGVTSRAAVAAWYVRNVPRARPPR